MQSFIQISRQKMWDVIFELKTIKSNRYLVLLHLKPDMASRSCSRPESSRVPDGNKFLLLGNNGPTAFQRCVDRDDAKEFLNNKFSIDLRFGFYNCSFTKWQLNNIFLMQTWQRPDMDHPNKISRPMRKQVSKTLHPSMKKYRLSFFIILLQLLKRIIYFIFDIYKFLALEQITTVIFSISAKRFLWSIFE